MGDEGSGSVEDVELGRLARELIDLTAQFRDMLAIDAPASVLSRQLDEMEAKLTEIDLLSGGKLAADENLWTMLGSKMGKLYEVMQYRDSQS